MPNTTKPARPSVATMRARLVKAGMAKADAAALDPKSLVEAHAALADQPATPAPAKAKAPRKAKPAAAAKPDADGDGVVRNHREPRNCGCGCGAPTITERASFLPGHDARFAGLVGRGEIEPADWQTALITDALAKKIDGIRETAKKRDAVKAAREAAKAAAKAAFEAAMA